MVFSPNEYQTRTIRIALPETNSVFTPENGWLEYDPASFWDGGLCQFHGGSHGMTEKTTQSRWTRETRSGRWRCWECGDVSEVWGGVTSCARKVEVVL